MRNFAITTALSALFIAAPLAGAYAESAENSARDGHPYVDEQTTQAVPQGEMSNYDMLETELVAAETNLEAGQRDNAMTESDMLEYQGEIDSIRQAVSEERDMNGELSAASFENYQNQIMVLQQAIETSQAGG